MPSPFTSCPRFNALAFFISVTSCKILQDHVSDTFCLDQGFVHLQRLHCTFGQTIPRTLNPRRSPFRAVTTTSTILLGPEEAPRLVPRELLTAVSPFFHAALTGTFAEGLSQTVRLPEDRADVFDYFLYWLYTRRLDHEAVDAVEPIKPAYFWLLHLYCLVDKFGIDECKNAIVEKVAKLAEDTNSVPTPTDTWIVYSLFEHQENNRMRKLIVDLFAWKRTDNLLESHEDEWHPRFMRDLVVKIKREDVKTGVKPWLRDMCRYHEHPPSEKCS